MSGLEQLADELYGLPVEQFTAARDTHVKAAKANGDKPLAAALAALRRPTAAAALVNQLMRAEPGTAGQLRDLGAQLREAQATLSAPALRALSQQRQHVVAALAARAREVAAAAGQRVADATLRDVEDTLAAALADDDAAVAVTSGRLARGTSYAGFGPGVSMPAPPDRADELAAARDRKADRDRSRAAEDAALVEQREAREARRVAEAARADDERRAARAQAAAAAAAAAARADAELTEADAALTLAAERHADARTDIERLTAELADARQLAAAAGNAEATARRTRDQVAKARDAAHAAHQQAQTD